MAKIKMKSHSGLKKVCKARKNDVKIGVAKTNHNTGKQTPASKRNKRKGNTLSTADHKRIKAMLNR